MNRQFVVLWWLWRAIFVLTLGADDWDMHEVVRRIRLSAVDIIHAYDGMRLSVLQRCNVWRVGNVPLVAFSS